MGDGGCDLMREGDNIVLDVNGEKLSFHKLSSASKARVGKQFCAMSALIGLPFGTLFFLDRNTLLPTDELATDGFEVATSTERSNATLVAGDNQQLSQRDVEQLKQERAGGDIIEALASGSATFAGKTEFSQEKWRKKKAKKYLLYATARRPTARLICEAYFSKSPAKIFNLRPDSLAVMLSLANVGAHGRVLCVDATGGVVAAACAERLGGHGTLCCVHAEDRPYPLDAVRQLNAAREVAKCARQCALADLLGAHAEASEGVPAAPGGETQPPAGAAMNAGAQGSADVPASAAADATVGAGGDQACQSAEQSAAMKPSNKPGGKPSDAAGAAATAVPAGGQPQPQSGGSTDQAQRASDQKGGESAPGQRRTAASRGGARRLHEDSTGPVPDRLIPASRDELALLARQGFTSVVLAAPRLECVALLRALLPLVRPSAAFAAFSSALQPLTLAFAALQRDPEFISLQLQESWWREHQVLPARTHPMMSTSGTGGYVLSGIRVAASVRPKAAAGGGGSNPAKRQRT